MIFTYESQSYTQRTVLLDFIAFFACAKEEEQRAQQQQKKTQTEINIFRSTDMHQKRASTTYIAYKRRHTYLLKRRSRGAYITQTQNSQ